MKALWLPVAFYLAVTLGVPLLHPRDARFTEHAVIVVACTAVLILARSALLRLTVRAAAPVSAVSSKPRR